MRWFLLGVCHIMAICGYAFDSKIATIVYDPTHEYAYLAQVTSTQIHYCAINRQTLNSCRATGPTYFIRPISLAMHPNGQYLYVLDDVYQLITKCTIQIGTGQLQDCQEMSFAGSHLRSITISTSSQTTYLYVAHGEGVSKCALDAQGNAANCELWSRDRHIVGLSMNRAGNKLYLLSPETMTICPLAFSLEPENQCRRFYLKFFTEKKGLAHNIYSNTKTINHESYISSFSIDESGVLSLVNHYSDGSDFRCNINQSTADYHACFTGGNQQGYSVPLSMVINTSDSRIYILSLGLVKLGCVLDSNGFLHQCTPTQQELPLPVKDIML